MATTPVFIVTGRKLLPITGCLPWREGAVYPEVAFYCGPKSPQGLRRRHWRGPRLIPARPSPAVDSMAPRSLFPPIYPFQEDYHVQWPRPIAALNLHRGCTVGIGADRG
jgi:hypothetical protein